MENVGFWPRVGAYLIDVVILSIPVGIAFGVFAVVAGGGEMDVKSLEPLINIAQGLSALVTILYFTLMNGAFGATLGKMALGMKVVRADGSPIGYGLALGRIVLMNIMSSCTCGLFFVSVATNQEYRGWHDQIVGTRVIYTR